MKRKQRLRKNQRNPKNKKVNKETIQAEVKSIKLKKRADKGKIIELELILKIIYL